MKVGIFTFPNSTSYGATLQMYALYNAVNCLGHESEIINYHNAYMKAEKHKTAHTSGLSGVAKKAVSDLLHFPMKCRFRSFEKRRMTAFPKRSIDIPQTLYRLNERYDAVICGSDQVWNPDITNHDLSYFLDFCDSRTRRISYAPSFGVKSLSDDFSQSVARELALYHAISVRESTGQELISKLIGREVPIVLDPTMLLTANQWKELEQPHPVAKGAYILYYAVKSSTSLMKFCKQLSANTGIKIVVVGGNPITSLQNRDRMVEYAVDISPEQWLYLMRNAAYVVTNSFHGTAFSVNFRKNFYVEFSSLTNSRLEHIIQMLELEDCVVQCDTDAVAKDTNYAAVDRKLPCLIADSIKYLECALEEGRAHG